MLTQNVDKMGHHNVARSLSVWEDRKYIELNQISVSEYWIYCEDGQELNQDLWNIKALNFTFIPRL